MLHVQGTVFPASTDNVDICAKLTNGEHRYTEWMVRKPGKPPLERAYLVTNDALLRELDRQNSGLKRVIDPETGQVEIRVRQGRTVSLEQGPIRAPRGALQAIADADIVVIGPGSLYTSVITNLLVSDIQKALIKRAQGKTIYVCNIVTQPGQTDNFRASDHLKAILKHLPENQRDGAIDHTLVQDLRIFQTPKSEDWHPLLKKYKKDGKVLVECDTETLNALGPWTRADFLEEFHPDAIERDEGDFINHDPAKVADAICRIFCGLSVPDYWGLDE